MFKLRYPILVLLLTVSCKNDKSMQNTLDIQGHRGCRGLMPENTIPAFLKALEIGVTTLEMDLVISKDLQVVVSHEPFFSHIITSDPEGRSISAKNDRLYNMYEMNYDEIMQYDVGLKPHPRFPRQEKIPAIKPLFKDVVLQAEKFAIQNNITKPYYNVEIKRVRANDQVFHPSGEEFARLVVEAVQQTNLKERILIQSFDPESLRFVRKLDAEIKLALLVENSLSPEENLEILGFTPEVYSPDYSLVNPELIDFCKEKEMELIPWTVNDGQQMKKLIALGVDGIITDYPDILNKVLTEMGITRK